MFPRVLSRHFFFSAAWPPSPSSNGAQPTNAKSSSRLIAQLWNGRVSDRIEIDRRTEQFNRLVKTHNAEAERTLSQAASTSEKKEQVAGKLTRSVRNLADTPKLPSPEIPNAEPVAVEEVNAANLQQIIRHSRLCSSIR